MNDRPVALITGATAGLGREFARQLAPRYDLVLVARDGNRLNQVAAEERDRGAAVEVVVADLRDHQALAAVEARLAEGVDLLVNNAGFGLNTSFADSTAADQDALLAVLVGAVQRLCHAAVPVMLARGSGAILNVSSVAAFLPRGTYSAAKAWVNSFSVGLHAEYAARGVRVTAVCPGFTRTEFHERMGMSQRPGPSWLWLDPEYVVHVALRDLQRSRALSIPSWRYRVLVALLRLLPTRLVAALTRR